MLKIRASCSVKPRATLRGTAKWWAWGEEAYTGSGATDDSQIGFLFAVDTPASNLFSAH